MSGSLFGGVEEPATDRLFLALFPDPETAARIAALTRRLAQRHGLAGRPHAPERFHVTQHHLGDFVGLSRRLVDDACAGAAALKAAAFDIEFDTATSFIGKPGNHPFVLRGGAGTQAVSAFQQALGQSLLKAGVKSQDRAYTPHLTLLYDAKTVEAKPIEPIRWTAREFVLVRSLLGRTQHVVLGRWSL